MKLKRPSPSRLVVMGWLVCFGASSFAETINFYNPPNQTNLTSSGSAMDGSFVFQLGVFTNGFVPTRANITQWNSRWAAAEGASYLVSNKSFDETHTVSSNISPFLVGTAAWVWGKRSTSAGDEWILFRNSGWTWPAPNLFSPFPLDWNAANANQVVIGSINGPGHLMKSESVMTYSQWQSGMLAGEPLNSPTSDPDEDGVNNLLEFVFGTDPQLAGPAPQTPLQKVNVGGNDYLQIQIPRLRGRLASLTVRVSSDLVVWNSGSGHTVEVSNTVDSWVVRDLTPIGGGQSKRFLQLKAELP